MSYKKASPIADIKREPDVADASRIANNTAKIAYKDGRVAYRLHDTDVLTLMPNGDTVLSSGGWRTVTTKQRINAYLHRDYGITQSNYEWYLTRTEWEPDTDGGTRPVEKERVPFYDGIKITRTVKII